MAKRGEKRPWRVRFLWENGVKGTETFASVSDVRSFVEKIRATAESRDMGLSLTLEKDGQSHTLKGWSSSAALRG